jgi:type I restriction enzyme, S subunit
MKELKGLGHRTSILLSIKPKYVELISNGNKEYEFRKRIFKFNRSSKIYIYASSPIKKIIGYFIISEIIEDHPKRLWETFEAKSGINESDFFSYFNENSIGYAIRIRNFVKFEEPIDPKKIITNFYPPQSFSYIEDINLNMKTNNLPLHQR